MLDIHFIRDNKELIQEAVEKKGVKFSVDELLEIDDRRIVILQEVEKMRHEQNEISNHVVTSKDENERNQLIQEMRVFKDDLKEKEEVLKETLKEWRALMLRVPNMPDVSVPEGKSEDDNPTIHEKGEKPSFNFTPKDHIDLMINNKMVDLERGSKVHGFRGYFLTGYGAKLSWALWNYARDFYEKRGFADHFIAPAIVKEEYFYGTGHLPNDSEDLFKTQDNDYLSGTAEVPMMAYHGDEILTKEELPKKYLAFSPCYRREAGSYGKDERGVFRVHEFFKLEQLILCEASHETSVELHEELTENLEAFLESLSLPYRRIVICTGDLKSAQVKSYDVDVWFPSQEKYREAGSISYYHDFQSRRFNIKYKDGDTKPYAHSLNATAVATPRLVAALVENYQNEDGSIQIPEVLQKYVGAERIG